MPLIPGPYEVGAPDGHRYFTILGPQVHLLNGYRLLLDARDVVSRLPSGTGKASALVIDTILKDTQTAVNAAAIETAAVAERTVRGFVRARQLRPDPPGKGAGARLQDAITARAIRTFPAGGAVGIGDLDDLAKVVGDDGQEYWRAQEFGSTHLVGRALRGRFQPGNVAPNPADFRVHPVFEGVSYVPQGGRLSGPIIHNPIPEKAFLREGAYAAAIFRRDAFRKIERTAVSEMNLVGTGNHPRLRNAARSVRGRRIP